ncbi:hypothetical protein Ancab_025098 [Ancistrocladus abbreviatus]
MEDSSPPPTARPLIPGKTKSLSRALSFACDELQSFRSCLRWLCVDQLTCLSASLSWFVFILLAIAVPAISHFFLICSSCDSHHRQPYDAVVQLSLSSVATLSFLCLSGFARKYGLRRFLFFDRLVDESETVRRNYTVQLHIEVEGRKMDLYLQVQNKQLKYAINGKGSSKLQFLLNHLESKAMALVRQRKLDLAEVKERRELEGCLRKQRVR